MHGSLWPSRLLIVRHGESAGNVARDIAEANGHAMIDIALRDMDVPLSALGEQQAHAVGEWIGARDNDERPTVVVCSPYVRACSTAEIALHAGGLRPHHDVEFVVDERLREREFGVLDRLTRAGIVERHPEQANFRSHLGKFYHRPPGGESWADVVLRVRSLIDSVSREFHDERVLVVTHQVVVLMFRYVLEHLTEYEILAIDREAEVANCSVTSYAYDEDLGRRGGMQLTRFNEVAPLVARATAVTSEPDVPAAPK